MVDSIKITALQDIGANIAYTTLVPLVNMAGTPITQKSNLQNLGNLILNGAGGSYFAPAARAISSQVVTNAAQPNITSVGTLTSLAVTGNITTGNINGGNIVVANFYYGDGRFLTNVVANSSYSNSNVANYLPTYTGNVGAGNVNVADTVYTSGISSTGLSSLTILNVSTTANLGAVGNVIIAGGSAGQKLTTDGAGNLSWTNDANSSYGNTNVANYLPTFTGTVGANRISSNALSGSNLEISANGAVFMFGQGGALYWPAPGGNQWAIEPNIDNEFEIKSTSNVVISTDTSNANSHFTFDTNGIFTAPSNVNLLGSRLNVGPDAASAGNLLNPTLVIANTGAQYIQAAIINNDGAGSSDWSADGAGGGDDEAWTDMGFAGFSFNDANFSITEPGDGYLFVQAYANGLGGNMVLATGEHSNTADIIFATGGFLANNEFARINHSTDSFVFARPNTAIQFADGSAIVENLEGTGDFGVVTPANVGFMIETDGVNAYSWTFGKDGLLTLPEGAIIDTLGNNFEVRAIENVNFEANAVVNIYTDGSNNAYQWQFGDDGLITLPGGNTKIGTQYGSEAILASNVAFGVVSQGSAGMTALQWTDDISNTSQFSAVYINDSSANAGDIQIRTGAVGNANIWKFGNDGNLTLPNNTFAVNYANGTPVVIGGGGGNTGNVTFDDNIVIGTGDEYGGGGLYLAVGPNSIANSASQYLRVRGGDAPTHIHLDTGNSQAYDQYFGDDAKYVKLELGDAGNVVIGTNDANGNLYSWTFTSDGNFILANGNSVIKSIANSSLDPINPNVSTMILTPDPGYSSQSLVLDPTAPGHIHLRAPSQAGNIDIPAANIFLGGEDTSFEVTVGANNYAVIHSNGKSWTFGNDGNISSDTLTFTTTFANVKTVEYQTAGVWDLYVEDSITGSNAASSRLNVSFKDNLIDKPQVYIENTKENDGIALRWTFDENGNLNFPRDVAGNSDPYLSIFGGATPTIQSTDASLAGPANLAIQSNYLNLSGFSGDKIVFYADTGEMATDANMTLTTNLANTGNTSSWVFGNDGNLTIPGTSGGFIKTVSNASIGIAAMDNGTNNPAQLLSMNVGNGNATSIVSAYSTNVAIQTNAAGAINTWAFDSAGNLTLPGNAFAVNYANGTQVSFIGSNIANGNSNVTIATSAGNVVTNVNAQTILTVYSGGIKVGGSGVLQSPGGATAVTLNNNGANLPIANITNTLNVTGAAGANITSNLVVGGTVTATGKIGYSTGGNATQASTGAGVTINQLTGLVTLANRTYNAGDLEAFSISCNKVSNDDFVLVQMVDSVNAPSYNVVAYPNTVLANTISVLMRTLVTVGTDTPILKFMVVKAPLS